MDNFIVYLYRNLHGTYDIVTVGSNISNSFEIHFVLLSLELNNSFESQFAPKGVDLMGVY